MRYEVRFVGDSDLPSGVEYAFVRLVDQTYLFIKESSIVCPQHRAELLTRSFTTWERAQSVELKELTGALQR